MADEKPPISEGLTSSLFERIKEFFAQMWANFWAVDPMVLVPFSGAITQTVTEKMQEQTAKSLYDGLLNVFDKLEVPQEIRDSIAGVVTPTDAASVAVGYLVTLAYNMRYFIGHASVAGELASHEWRAKYRPTIPDVGTLIVNLYRQPLQYDRIVELLKKLGYSDEAIDILFKASKSIYSVDELKNLFLRGELDEQQVNDGLKRYGFTDEEVEGIKKLFYPIPNYPDLVRMAVREAFSDEYVEEFGLLQELPESYMENAVKTGLSEEWAKRFWAAHWELPSILRGYEMLHRGIIDEEQLDKLMVALDIMPWWRDKLKAISYSPLTRVDVRRVYRMGIIDREQVKRTYLDLGYDEEKAEWLTKFTEMEQGQEEKDLSKAEILDAYVKKIIGYPETQQLLIDLGYNEDEVEILISSKEYQEFKANKERELDRIKRFFLAGAYTANQAINALGKLDLTGAEQDSYITLWDSERLAKLRSPTKSDLDKLYAAGIINDSQYQFEMRQLGYQDRHVQWFLDALKGA